MRDDRGEARRVGRWVILAKVMVMCVTRAGTQRLEGLARERQLRTLFRGDFLHYFRR